MFPKIQAILNPLYLISLPIIINHNPAILLNLNPELNADIISVPIPYRFMCINILVNTEDLRVFFCS